MDVCDRTRRGRVEYLVNVGNKFSRREHIARRITLVSEPIGWAVLLSLSSGGLLVSQLATGVGIIGGYCVLLSGVIAAEEFQVQSTKLRESIDRAASERTEIERDIQNRDINRDPFEYLSRRIARQLASGDNALDWPTDPTTSKLRAASDNFVHEATYVLRLARLVRQKYGLPDVSTDKVLELERRLMDSRGFEPSADGSSEVSSTESWSALLVGLDTGVREARNVMVTVQQLLESPEALQPRGLGLSPHSGLDGGRTGPAGGLTGS